MSKLYVNEIKPKTSGNIVTGLSNILEVVPLNCDGQAVTVPSGTYTPENVTSAQALTTTYADVTGSKINYTPPEGTIAVIYDFNFASKMQNDHSIGSFRFYVGSTDVVYARMTIGGHYPDFINHFRWVIPIGGNASSNTGRVASWGSPLELKLTAREHGSANQFTLHTNNYFDGTGTDVFHAPQLTLTAIGGVYNG